MQGKVEEVVVEKGTLTSDVRSLEKRQPRVTASNVPPTIYR